MYMQSAYVYMQVCRKLSPCFLKQNFKRSLSLAVQALYLVGMCSRFLRPWPK